MYRIIEGRGTGKTLRLMLLAKENNGVLVCSNPYAMEQKARAYGLTGFQIIGYHDYLNDIYDWKTAPCFIDELEEFVKWIGNDLSGYTLSLE